MQTRATIDRWLAMLAERVGLTRALPALALRARCARPKSLQAVLSNPRVRPHLHSSKFTCTSNYLNRISTESVGGEGGIRTHEHLLECYTLSRRAPSTARPPLLAAARVPERTQVIKSASLPAGGLVRGRGLVARWNVEALIVRAGRRRRVSYRGNNQSTRGIGRIESRGHLQRRGG